jgi:ATP-dependent RNA circularization protein (DNA/RNA ligase family)
LIGMGVQGNKYKLSGLEFRVFNVFDINLGKNLDYNDFKEVVYNLGLTPVPIISEDYLLPKTVDELVEYSKGKSVLNKDTHREGIVLRPLVEEYSEDLRSRLSFKCINPDFLLKYNE